MAVLLSVDIVGQMARRVAVGLDLEKTGPQKPVPRVVSGLSQRICGWVLNYLETSTRDLCQSKPALIAVLRLSRPFCVLLRPRP